jgi:nucleolar GTP-binding protein
MSLAEQVETIPPILNAAELIDFALNSSKSDTFTSISPEDQSYGISKVRKFYIRKIKLVSQSFLEKINAILEQFPKIEVCPLFAQNDSLTF